MATWNDITDPEELGSARSILRRLDQGKEICALFGRLESRPVLAGSQIAADDTATAWMNLSHLVSVTLSMTTDNMRALDRLLRPDNDNLVLPLYAHYPIIRSILESAARAKWILAPDDRAERVARVLRARVQDAEDDAALARVELETVAAMDVDIAPSRLAEQRAINARTKAKYLDKARELAARNGIPWTQIKGGTPGWQSVFGMVGEMPATDDTPYVPAGYVSAQWKLLSGLSHPSASRAINHSSMTELDRAGGVVTARLTASTERTLDTITVAFKLAQDAMILLDARGAKDSN